MPTATDVREWARENGHAVTGRGRVPATVLAAYNDAHPDDPMEPGGAVPSVPDYPDEDFEAAFADMPAAPGDPGETGETRPRKPAPRGKPSSSISNLFGRKSSGARGKKKPRVSTEDLLGAVWRGLAGMAKPIPPLHRTLRIQAPVAGAVLEDTVKGTVIDPILQPLARLAGSGKAIHALVGPPVYVTAISAHVGQCAAAGTEPNPLFMSVSMEGLRSALMAWMDVAGPRFDAAMKREREFEQKYGKSVDELIAYLFSDPGDPEQEEAAIRRAQGLDDRAPA